MTPVQICICDPLEDHLRSFTREVRGRNVTCIPMEKARRDFNADNAVFLPKHSFATVTAVR